MVTKRKRRNKMSWLKSVFTEPVRAWIYRVLIAVGAVVGAYGLLEANEVATWLGLAAVVLNIMPAGNTSVKK
jgi:hypothetical protein